MDSVLVTKNEQSFFFTFPQILAYFDDFQSLSPKLATITVFSSKLDQCTMNITFAKVAFSLDNL